MKKLTQTIATLGLVGCAVIISPSAMADESGWYSGLSAGASKAKINDPQINTSLINFNVTSLKNDNKETGFKIFGGYKFNKHFAFEAGYFYLGKFDFTATTVPAGVLSGSTKLGGVNFDVVGIVPVTEKFSAFGRIGMNYAEAKDTFISTGAAPVQANLSPSKRAANPKAGLGIQYNFSQSVGLRAEAERYRINDAIGNTGDIDVLSLGIVYRFGVNKPIATPAPKVGIVEAVILPVL